MAHTLIHDENEGESASPFRMIRKVVRVTTNKDQPSDYQYWITRPVAGCDTLRLGFRIEKS